LRYPLSLDFDFFLGHGLILTGAGILVLALLAGFTYVILKTKIALPITEIFAIMNSTLRRSAPQRIFTSKENIFTVVRSLIFDVALQRTVLSCDRLQWLSHFTMFWGFIGLAITTTLDSIFNPNVDPLPISHFVRVLGNTSGALFLVGGTIAIMRRFSVKPLRDATRGSDSLFLFLIYFTVVSGFLVEISSDLNLISTTFVTYWVHIGLVTALLASVPFTKFAHALWRPLWALYVRFEEEYSRRRDELLEAQATKG